MRKTKEEEVDSMNIDTGTQSLLKLEKYETFQSLSCA